MKKIDLDEKCIIEEFKKLTIPQNCISLCTNCHVKTNYDRESWKKMFQEKLTRLYNYQYENGEVILNFKQQTLG
jgi:hypothetical protein